MNEPTPQQTPWHYRLIWSIVMIQAALIVLILAGLFLASRAISPILSIASDDLIVAFRDAEAATQYVLDTVETYEGYPLQVHIEDVVDLGTINDIRMLDELPVSIRQEVPFQTEVLFEDTVPVAVDTIIEISDIVSLPLGPINVGIPLDLTIPVQQTLITPFSTIIPIDIVTPVEIDFVQPLDLSIPLLDANRETLKLDLVIDVEAIVPTHTLLDDIGTIDVVRGLNDYSRSNAELLEFAQSLNRLFGNE